MALTKVTSGLTDLDGGITIDNITIDGTEIDLSSGDLTIDVAGSIILDADSTGVVDFKDGGTHFGRIENSSSDFKLEARVQDKDMVFVGNDGGSGITALTLDMSDAGNAIFGGDIIANKALRLRTTDDQAQQWYVYTHTDDTFRINYNGAGADALIFDTSENATFSGTVTVGDTVFDAVGTYCFANSSGSVADRDGGATLAGSSLRTANSYTDYAGQHGFSNESLSGTWRLMGQTAEYAGGTVNAAGALCTSLWVRIS